MKQDHDALYPKEILDHRSPALGKMIFYRKTFHEFGYTLLVKPFYMERDLATIYKWVNAPYAKEFWQMHGTKEGLYRHYKQFLDSGNGYSLMFFIKNKPVALVDFYDVMTDEIKDHYEAKPDDHGIHVLMGMHKKILPGLSTNVVITCLHYLFTLSIERIMGEPDAMNEKANELVKRVGFRFMKQVQMSYKMANLYTYERTNFLREHP